MIRRELLRLSGRTAHGLRSADALARTVVVELRLANFTTITRSRTLPEPTDVARTIYDTACALHAGSGLDSRARLRLVGVRATGLLPVGTVVTQLALGEEPPAPRRDAEQAVDRIAGRFGTGTVRPAALVPPPPPPPRHGDPRRAAAHPRGGSPRPQQGRAREPPTPAARARGQGTQPQPGIRDTLPKTPGTDRGNTCLFLSGPASPSLCLLLLFPPTSLPSYCGGIRTL